MVPRVLLVPCFILTIWMPALAGSTDPNTSKPFLTPPEVVEIVDKSEVMYKIITGMKGLEEEVNRANTANWLFPLSVPEITCPWRIQKDDGSVEVVEFPFSPECSKLFNEAEVHFLSRRFPQAVRGYQSVIDRFPDCYLAYAHMGDAYYNMKQYATAIKYFDIAIELNPWDHRTFLYKADALMNLGRHEEAKTAYIHSLSLRPRYWVALANLQRFAGTLGVQVRTDLFEPQTLVRREKDYVAVYVGDKDSMTRWMIYALVKAVWQGEPSHRQEMLGDSAPDDSTYNWSSTEETEALLNLIVVYKRARQEGKVLADAKLDLLEQIVDAGDLNDFIAYEIASRMNPQIMLTFSEEARQSLREFIAKYVVVSAPKQPGEETNRRVAIAVVPAGTADRQVSQ